MEIQVIEKTIVQKWMKDDKYDFEVPLEDIWKMIHHITYNEFISEYEIHEMADKLMIPYFVDNNILSNYNNQYFPGPNFEEFSDLIYKSF